MGAWLLSSFALAVNATSNAWIPGLISALWRVQAACALYRLIGALYRFLKHLKVSCVDDKLAPFHNGNLLCGSLHPFGSADTFAQLVPILLASLFNSAIKGYTFVMTHETIGSDDIGSDSDNESDSENYIDNDVLTLSEHVQPWTPHCSQRPAYKRKQFVCDILT